jgi:hypothetical protein
MAFAKRGGRKSVVSPDGVATVVSRPQVDSTLVKALARAFRWRKLLETGVYVTIDEMAAAERINGSSMCRVLRLTLLQPETVEAILNGRQPAGMTLAVLMRPFSVKWERRFMTGNRTTGLAQGSAGRSCRKNRDSPS